VTEILDEKLRAARIILGKLEEGQMRWTYLVKAVVKESPSPWKAQTIIEWLLENKHIERPERGLYQITEKGRQLLTTV